MKNSVKQVILSQDDIKPIFAPATLAIPGWVSIRVDG